MTDVDDNRGVVLGDQIESLTAVQMKVLLRQKGLKVSGRKQELAQRLLEANAAPKEGAGAETEVETVVETEAEAEIEAEIEAETEAETEAEVEVEALQKMEELDDVDEDDIVLEDGLDYLTVPQLKDMLRQKGLKSSGRKEVLVQRLLEPDAETEEGAPAQVEALLQEMEAGQDEVTEIEADDTDALTSLRREGEIATYSSPTTPEYRAQERERLNKFKAWVRERIEYVK